jgi:hypothetical protein
MSGYQTFGEFLGRREAANRAGWRPWAPGSRESDLAARSRLPCDLPEPDAARGGGHVDERSVFGDLLKSPFRAVNPSRPVLPTNARLLASPLRTKRLESQVVGR